MDLKLQDKVALVTGGVSGIGEAIVRQLVAEGARVAAFDRDITRGENLASELPLMTFVEVDLCDDSDCERCVSSVIDHYSKIDIVVNNAGTNDAVGVGGTTQEFEMSIKRNLLHYFSVVSQAAESLRSNRGCIVNIGSKVAETGQGGTSGYAAAKGAVNGLTREWAADFAKDGVRVNAVIPAEVWTPMYENWLNNQADGVTERERIEARIPLGNRFTKPQEIANAVVFLCSSAASHITGQILHVDGGYVHLDRRLSS